MTRGFVAAALLAAFSLTALAQDAVPPAVLQIQREGIKEGRSSAHEKVEMDYPRAFHKANFPYHYLALTTMTGPSEAWFLMAYPSFVDVEKSDKTTQTGALKNDLDLLDARDGELRSNSRSMYAVYRKDLSYHPELANVGKTRYVSIGSLRVRLGHDEDLINGSKMFLGAYEKANLQIPILTYQVIAGVPEGLYLFIEPMESLKSLDEMPMRERALAQAMGEDNFRRLMKSSGEVFQSIETSFFSVNPRMSYVSKETEDMDPSFWRPKAAAPKPAADTTKPKTSQ